MIDGFKYLAFISYKREDEKWAKWLQHKLEHYKLPISVRKANPSLPERVRPIFKDTTDLAGGVLEKALTDALHSSKYLIVICSPRAAQSPWVCKEVQEFINSGREEFIIPFIVNGEPNPKDSSKECFPQNLKELTGSRELLGININENGRDAAAIKVIARMLDIQFDTLWQRFRREKKTIRRLTLLGLITVILLVTGIAIWISLQNHTIQLQNIELGLKSDSILLINKSLVQANDSIKTAYTKLNESENNLERRNFQLRESNNRLAAERNKVMQSNRDLKFLNAKIQSQYALTLLESGNLLEAQNILKRIASDDLALELMDQPEVEMAFRTIYREITRNGFKHRFSLDHIGHISFFEFDITGDELYIGLNDSIVQKINLCTGKQTIVGTIHVPVNADVELYTLNTENGDVYYSIDNIFYIENLYNNSKTTHFFDNEIYFAYIDPYFKYIIVNEHKNDSYVIDAQKAELIHEKIPNLTNVYSFSSDGCRIFAEIGNEYCIYNVKNRIIEKYIPWDIDIYVDEAHFTTDGTCILIFGYEAGKYEDRDIIKIYNLTLDKFINIGLSDELSLPNIDAFNINPQSNRIITAGNGIFNIHDVDDLPYVDDKNICGVSADIIESINGTNSDVVRSIKFNSSGKRMVTETDNSLSVWDVMVNDLYYEILHKLEFVSCSGNSFVKLDRNRYAHLYDTNTKSTISRPLFKQPDDINSRYRIKAISRNNETVIGTTDSLIHVLLLNSNCYYKIPFNCHEYSLEVSLDTMGCKLAVWDGPNGNDKPSLKVYDLMSSTYTTLSDETYYCNSMCLSPDGEEIVVASHSGIYIYQTADLTQKKLLNNGQGFIYDINFSSDGKYIAIVGQNRTINIWDKSNGKLTTTLYGANQQIHSCRFSANGKYLSASTYLDRSPYRKSTTYIWNLKSGEIVEKFENTDLGYNFCYDDDNTMYQDYNRKLLHFPSIDELIIFFK